MPIEILMPALSPTMTEGNLAKWIKKEGDKVKPGEVIAEIETDKATMEVEAVDEGVIGKIFVKDGAQNVPVNQLIALLLADGEDKKAIDSYQPKAAPAPKADAPAASASAAPAAPSAAPSAAPTAAPSLAPKPTAAPAAAKAPAPVAALTGKGSVAGAPISASGKRVAASPLARRLAEDYGVDLGAIVGTGPKGRVVSADIEEYIARGGSKSGIVRRDPSGFARIEHTQMRKVIARRLLESKQQVPHFYLSVDCQLDKLLDMRQQVNDAAPSDASGKPTYKVSVNDMIIKAVALGMKDVPAANASWYDDAAVQYTNIDISVAVATPTGLITPIIFNADQKSIPQISNEMKDLAARARENKLRPEEFQGGGFSISNLGMFGVKEFAAIINPPQGCIMAVGEGSKRAVVNAEGQVVPATVMTVTLSVDHRIVDGAVGAQFLQAFKKYIEAPVRLVL